MLKRYCSDLGANNAVIQTYWADIVCIIQISYLDHTYYLDTDVLC